METRVIPPPKPPQDFDVVRFAFWPWGLMALAVPVPATLIYYLANEKQSAFAHLPADGRALALYCAGNSMILAMATGSLMRMSIAVPVGAAAGLLAAGLMHFELLYWTLYAGISFLCLIWMMLKMAELQMDAQFLEPPNLPFLKKFNPGTVSIGLLLFLFTGFVFTTFAQAITPPACACLLLAATMPGKNQSVEYRWPIFEGLVGVFFGFAAYCLAFVAEYILYSFLIWVAVSFNSQQLNGATLSIWNYATMGAFCVFNLVYIRQQFVGLTRALRVPSPGKNKETVPQCEAETYRENPEENTKCKSQTLDYS